MGHPLRLLIVDDQPSDAELTAHRVARCGYSCTWRRVETEGSFRAGLRDFAPDLIISDFSLPQYDGLSALNLAVQEAPNIPFIFVSGTIGTERAMDALSRGAADYLCKSDLTRLAAVIARVLTSRATTIRAVPTDRIARVTEALEALSGIRAGAALALHTRPVLLEDACVIIQGTELYDYSFITLVNPYSHVAHTVAWLGAGADRGRNAHFRVAAGPNDDTSVVGCVLRTHETVLCLNIDQYKGAVCEAERGAAKHASPFVSLPLAGGTLPVGTLTVGATPGVSLSEQELVILERIAREISLALQSLPDEVARHHR